MFVRTAGERDLVAMRALLVETWHATYDAIYGAAKVTEITDDWHSIVSLKARLTRPNSEFLVADDGKRIGGMAFAAATADCEGHPVEPALRSPDCQRRGIGQALLDEIEASFPEAERCASRSRKPTAAPSPSTESTGFLPSGNVADAR